jgi:hypothetical protein
MLSYNSKMFKIVVDETFKKSFGYPNLYEIADDKALLYILNNWKQMEKQIDKDWDVDYKPKTIMTKYLNAYKKDNIISIKYKKSDNYDNKIGRFFCNGGVGIQSLPRMIRHTICRGLYIDLDFKNCHPTILKTLCEYYGIECKYLDIYVNNRDDILNGICQSLKVSKEKAKHIYLCALNGNKTHYDIQNWRSILLEFERIHTEISNKPEFEELFKEVKTLHKENVEAKMVNRILCYIENECLKVLFNILDSYKCFDYCKGDKIYKVCPLIFDGLQALDNKENRDLLTEDFLKTISKTIHKKTGFNLDIVIKEFDECLTLPENFEELNKNDNVITDDVEARDFVIKVYGDKYVSCNNIKYVKDGNIWTSQKEDIERIITNNIISCNLQLKSGDKITRYSGFKSSINNCKSLILSTGFRIDNDFITNNLNKSIYYLPFKDCVYCFKDKKTYNYDDLDICFTQFINRDFPHEFIQEDYDELLNRVISPIYPDEDERKFNAHIKARALAGCYTDKKWYVFQGARNSGKGVETSLLRNGFKCFVSMFDAKCLINNKFGNALSETALAWVVDKKESRMIISNEINGDDKTELNGAFIKTLASGGDEMEARKLYSNNQVFIPQFTMFLCCNTLYKPTDKSKDCLENMISFDYKSKFVEVDEIIDGIEYYKIKDDNIKDLVREDRIINAYIWYIINEFDMIRRKPPLSILNNREIEKEEETMTLEKYLLENYITTDSSNDKLHTSTILDDITCYDSFKGTATEIVAKTLIRLKIGKYYPDKITINKIRGRGFTNIKKKEK